ncbi:head decoration protein [Phenylobacterium sp.]|uniref:head decoration protein n=1 Tax=Phenylobacterium sp. TaxID=1871053 RepID=UPI0040370E34
MAKIGSSGPFVQPTPLGAWLEYEVNPQFTRTPSVLMAGDGDVYAVVSGQVLGHITRGEQTVTAGAVVSGSGGTPGNGAIGVVTADAGAPAGVYQVVILNAASNAGTFEVLRPDGSVDGNGTVGVAYNGSINFTLADGSNDFVEDDRIPVTVAYAEVSIWGALDPDAVDGLEVAAGIALYDAESPDGENGAVLVIDGGPTLVNLDELTWPDGITADELAAAEAQLRAVGIRKTPGAG